MNDDLMRRMRDHVGYDPEKIISGEQPANRAERRAAVRVLSGATKCVCGRLAHYDGPHDVDTSDPGWPFHANGACLCGGSNRMGIHHWPDDGHLPKPDPLPEDTNQAEGGVSDEHI